MRMNDLRTLMIRALFLDWIGQVVILGLILLVPALTGSNFAIESLEGQVPWIVFLLLLYPLLGWLFGSYTVLRWRRVSLKVLILRLLITAIVTLMMVAIARWLFNPSDMVWLVSRRVQFPWTGMLSLWALAVRIGLRRGLLMPDLPKILLMVHPRELEMVLVAWQRVPHRYCIEPVDTSSLSQQIKQAQVPILLVLSNSVRQDHELLTLLRKLEMCDPRQFRVLSVLSLFEQQQERLRSDVDG